MEEDIYTDDEILITMEDACAVVWDTSTNSPIFKFELETSDFS